MGRHRCQASPRVQAGREVNMSFAKLSEHLGSARKADKLPEEGVSPYRLLWGAAYAMTKVSSTLCNCAF